MQKAPNYNPENRSLQMTANGCSITVSFDFQDPETCIWHYVFAALAKQKPSYQPNPEQPRIFGVLEKGQRGIPAAAGASNRQ